MLTWRKYGTSPYTIVVVHGGPGAPGEMKQVAQVLSNKYGVIEPFQTKDSINNQIEELKSQITSNTNMPVILIGWSWGAWLSYLLTAKYPQLVRKLILISSGPFEEKYAKDIMPTRLTRLPNHEKQRVKVLMTLLQQEDRNDTLIKEFGILMSKADAYNPIKIYEQPIKLQAAIYSKVWNEGSKLRSTGKLLQIGKKIKCPVIAIHGDYDPHPAEGVKLPLSKVIKNFRFILLNNCGHMPWIEKESRDNFYKILNTELQ